MTREEAIEILHRVRITSFRPNGTAKAKEALDMAISVLEKPNYETDTEVRLVVVDRHKDKVVLFDDFGEVEYLPSEPSVTIQTGQTWGKSANIGKPTDLMSHEEAWEQIESDLISRADALAFPIRLDHYDEEHGNRHFVLGIETVMEYIESLPSVSAEPTMTEEVREALMRLTMCAREECGMCKYKDDCDFDKQYEMATKNMNTVLNAFCPNCGAKMGVVE